MTSLGRLIELIRPVDERPMFRMGTGEFSPAPAHRFKLAQSCIIGRRIPFCRRPAHARGSAPGKAGG